MVDKLSYICNRAKKERKEEKNTAFFPLPNPVSVRDFVQLHLRGYLRYATQISMGAYNTFANIVVTA